MNQPYNRISENILFTALLAVAIGGMAVSAATDYPTAPAPAASVVATTGANHS
jgi:hypothetical protein